MGHMTDIVHLPTMLLADNLDNGTCHYQYGAICFYVGDVSVHGKCKRVASLL